MRIEQIAIYVEGLYYKIEENGDISYAYGKNREKQLEKYIQESQEPIVLVNSIGIRHSNRLITAVNNRNRLLIMTQLRNLLIKLVEAKS